MTAELFPSPERYLYCDGASKGNPGPASIGAAIYDGDPKKGGTEIATISQAIGIETNNVAEYRSLIEGLQRISEMMGNDYAACKVYVRMDSQLVIRQVIGQYKVKNANLKPLYEKARLLLSRAGSYQAEHIPRELNKRADQLANKALK